MKLKDTQTVFGALADPTRFRILSLLAQGELCVCDLMSVLREPQSKVSRHLSYLRRAGLAEARKEGLWMYYRLAKPGARTFQAVLEALRHAKSDFKEIQNDLRVFQKSKSCLVACCS